jgi:hypothetical protein
MAEEAKTKPVETKSKNGAKDFEFDRPMTSKEKEEYFRQKESEARKAGKAAAAAAAAAASVIIVCFLFVCLSVSMSFCMSVLSPGRKKNISGRRSPKLGRLERLPLRLQLQQHR